MRLPENEREEDRRSKRLDLGLPPSGKTRRVVSRTSSSNENSNRFLIDHYRHQSNIGSMRTHRPSSEKIYSADSMIVSGGCLKRGRSSDSSRKKSVRFDCQSPPLIRMNSTPSLINEEKKFIVRHREEKTFQINSFQPTRVHLNEISTFTNPIHLSSTKNNESRQSNSISFITNPATFTISTDQLEPFYLSPPPTIQTSTLIISTPPQYHYYLYPSIRSSNGSVNSLSTTSSSSSNDFDDETCSSSISSSSNQQRGKQQEKFTFQGETPLESYRELFRDQPMRHSRSSSNDFQLKRQFFENQTFHDHQHRKVRPTRPDSLIRTSIKSRNDSLSTMNMTKTIDFLRDLFPPADEQRRLKTRSMFPTNDQSIDLNEQFKDEERILQNEFEINRNLGNQLIEMVEQRADQREIDKFKLHLNEIETITSVLLKLSSRWSKIENELRKSSSDETKTSLLDQRDKIRKKHDEAKYLKEGIDRRTRLMKIFLAKYFNDEQCEDFEYFIRMKSRLIVETKDIEEEILLLENQFRNSNELFINI